MARRKDVETGSRAHWNLEKFWWLKPAIRAKTLRIHLVGSVARLLVHPHQFFFLMVGRLNLAICFPNAA